MHITLIGAGPRGLMLLGRLISGNGPVIPSANSPFSS